MRAPMRRWLSILLLLVSVPVAAGCGGGDSSPLDQALSYLPRDAAFAVALDTDLDGDQYEAMDALLREFAFEGQARELFQEQLEQATGGRFDEDVRPLLGNPAVVGAREGGAAASPVLALKAEDGDRLDQLVERTNPRTLGEAAGATLYQDGGTVFATEDDMIVFASDRRQLTAALERADGDDHLDEETFESALEGLPERALARVYVDFQALLERDPTTEAARKVKWVAALRELGATVVATRSGLESDFRVRTEGDLTEADLPIAPGDEAPGVISREGELGLGIRDLAHIVRFAEDAGQAIDPGGFGDYAQAKKTIDSQLGVSLDDDLIRQLTGDVSASVALDGGFGVRAELQDPGRFRRTLQKVADVLPSFAEGAGFGRVQLDRPGAGEDFYELASPDGASVFFGVVGEVLVVASDGARAEELATEEPSPVQGATGSVVSGADAEQLANALLAEFGSQFGIPDLGGLGAAFITGPLGEIRGHVSASQDELRGKLTLAIE
jgi:Protein of unknown function (DUF3352)